MYMYFSKESPIYRPVLDLMEKGWGFLNLSLADYRGKKRTEKWKLKTKKKSD